jgi:hypothetical protein
MAIENNNPEEGISSEMRSNGYSVWPLSSKQLELIRGFFTYADNALNVSHPFDPGNLFPGESDDLEDPNPMEELRYLMSETIVIGKWIDGTVVYHDDEASLPAKQIEFITVLIAKDRDYPRADTYWKKTI